jgi:glycosyltransferase involved in cell wall biosynthesis
VKVLVAHTRYRQRGGEETVVDAECALLEQAGIDVVRHERDNEELGEMSRRRAAADTIWSSRARRELQDVVAHHEPDVVHFHNTFPLMSPAAYGAARASGAAVVQTLHNYRLVCPNALLLRDDRPCTTCVGKRVAWAGVRHACYHDSRAQSGVIAAMLAFHHARRTFRTEVDAFIALTDFGKDIMVRGGFPGERIHVKPNFLRRDMEMSGSSDVALPERPYVLFVGRLAREKGIDLLAAAWRSVAATNPDAHLVVVGDGPYADVVHELAQEHPRAVTLTGALPPHQVAAYMRGAQALVMTSTWYETFGMTAIESFAAGRPVIAPGHGAIGSIVDPGVTGWHYAPGDAHELAQVILEVFGDFQQAGLRGMAAADCFHAEYTAEANLPALLDVYQTAIERRRDQP